ncbi:MAG: ABC transporter substrate-binding protein [Actinobacteria bacterium]|nr:ABC transporter substrate-binding protein [Actinomycetota bacterium]
MRKRYIMAGLLVLLLAVAVVAAACGGETTTTAAPSTETTAAPTETTAAPTETAAAPTETTTATGPATGEPIKIGTSLSLTGVGAAPCKTFAQGIQARVDYVNAHGGVLGRPLQLIVYDDKTDVPTAIANINKLIQQDKVFATIGPFAQFMQEPARTLAEQYKVPMVGNGPATVEQMNGKKYQWSVMTAAGGIVQSDAVVKLIAKMGWKNILALGDTLDIDQETLKLTGDAAAANGYKFTLMPDTPELTTTDFQPILNKMMEQIQTLKPDAIIAYMNPLGFPAISAGLKGLGVTLPLVAGSSCAHPAVFSMGPQAIEGVYIPDPGGAANPQGLPDGFPTKSLLLDFAQIYQTKYNEPPDFFAADGSDLVTVLVAAMNQAGEVDQAKVAQALNNLKNLPTLEGPMNFSPEDNSMGARGSMVLWQMKNGQFQFVTDLN